MDGIVRFHILEGIELDPRIAFRNANCLSMERTATDDE
jgi:hypothetical protein